MTGECFRCTRLFLKCAGGYRRAEFGPPGVAEKLARQLWSDVAIPERKFVHVNLSHGRGGEVESIVLLEIKEFCGALWPSKSFKGKERNL
jgi:hypothetical protein